MEDDATGDAEVGLKGDVKTMRPLELGGRFQVREEDLRTFCIQPVRLGRVYHVPKVEEGKQLRHSKADRGHGVADGLGKLDVRRQARMNQLPNSVGKSQVLKPVAGRLVELAMDEFELVEGNEAACHRAQKDPQTTRSASYRNEGAKSLYARTNWTAAKSKRARVQAVRLRRS